VVHKFCSTTQADFKKINAHTKASHIKESKSYVTLKYLCLKVMALKQQK